MYIVQYKRPGGQWPLEIAEMRSKARRRARKWLESHPPLQRNRAAVAAEAFERPGRPSSGVEQLVAAGHISAET